jgi:hypothetical protein
MRKARNERHRPESGRRLKLEIGSRHSKCWRFDTCGSVGGGQFVFGALGLGLESLHAIKLPFYVAEASETRRLMWALSHAHGTGLAAINILFAVTLRSAAAPFESYAGAISHCLIAATIVLPLGFFLGGIAFYNGDPGIGGVGIPVGAMLLLIALALTAARIRM